MVRRVARVRLADRRLGRLLDSMDICQSVMASFFVRAALGQYELNTPDQLLRLLATMARNKLANQAHGQRARGATSDASTTVRRRKRRSTAATARRAVRSPRGSYSTWPWPPDRGERRLLERRQEGAKWAEIAMDEGDTPEALRKKLTRAVERVAREIGLDESGDG